MIYLLSLEIGDGTLIFIFILKIPSTAYIGGTPVYFSILQTQKVYLLCSLYNIKRARVLNNRM